MRGPFEDANPFEGRGNPFDRSNFDRPGWQGPPGPFGPPGNGPAGHWEFVPNRPGPYDRPPRNERFGSMFDRFGPRFGPDRSDPRNFGPDQDPRGFGPDRGDFRGPGDRGDPRSGFGHFGPWARFGAAFGNSGNREWGPDQRGPWNDREERPSRFGCPLSRGWGGGHYHERQPFRDRPDQDPTWEKFKTFNDFHV